VVGRLDRLVERHVTALRPARAAGILPRPAPTSAAKPLRPCGVRKLGHKPLSCEFVDRRVRYCDGSATPPQRSPGAVETGLHDAVSLHPAAGAPRPRRRRQRLGDLGAGPPARGAAPPDPASQAGARRSSAARRRQPGAAPRPLVVLLGAARDVAALASAPGCRRLDLPTPWTGTTAARPRHPGADRPPG